MNAVTTVLSQKLMGPDDNRSTAESLSSETLADLLQFLTGTEIVDARGRLLSWLNPEHPGFVYPEGMGLYLTSMCQLLAPSGDEALTRSIEDVAHALQDLVSPSGGIGLDGHLYVFDTCMAITGLLTYKDLAAREIRPGLIERMGHFVLTRLGEQRVVERRDGGSAGLGPKWSTLVGASTLKTVIALDGLSSFLKDARYHDLVLWIADQVVDTCYSDGAFLAILGDEGVYCHAHCYALEGLLHLRARGFRDTTELLCAGAQRLAQWQNEDGSLFNWYDCAHRERRKVGDATAQALRIWLAVDRGAFSPNIERGIAFLSSLRSPMKGLYYADGSSDINSITSIFAVQALDWYLRGARPGSVA